MYTKRKYRDDERTRIVRLESNIYRYLYHRYSLQCWWQTVNDWIVKDGIIVRRPQEVKMIVQFVFYSKEFFHVPQFPSQPGSILRLESIEKWSNFYFIS